MIVKERIVSSNPSNTQLWSVASFAMFMMLNMSVFTFLRFLYFPVPHVPSFLLAAIELVRVLLMIWLFFTVILKPKQGSLIPNLETQRNTAATNHLLTQVTFVFSWRLILFFLETAIIRGEITNDLTTQVLISLAMLVILWSIFRLYRWWRRRVRQQQETETPSNYAFAAKSDECQARAKRKISRRLTEAEQRELEQLAFEAEASNRTTFRLPITIVWILITMLIAQTVQEIFRRF